jgi:hypothetical protein|tara:strand:- start:352 stop:747 length:396 start_codon:yes stop_codon:yes gene_type:complete
MKLYLLRDYLNDEVTLGRLFNPIDNFHVHTLELPWKDNAKNISCIPKGEYIVELDYYHRGKYPAYELRNTPNRTEIKIHIGNYTKDVKGCIAIGSERDVPGQMVKQSRRAYEKFMEYTKSDNRFMLEIIEI